MIRGTPRSRLRSTTLALTALVLLAAACSSGDSALDRVGAPTMTGAWAAPPAGRGGDDPGPADYLTARSDLAGATSSDLPVAHFFYPWDSEPLRGGREARVVDQGDVPMVSWNDGDNQAIAAGADDDRIRQAARRFAGLDGPVLLRWGWEMDADSSNGGSGTRGGPDAYVAAWRHIHDLFGEEGADNVEFVWCPNAYAFSDTSGRSPTDFYPGDEYVDWLCADGYNWYPSTGTWRSFDDIFGDFYDWAEDRDKPVIIGEFGVLEDPADPGRKARWIRRAGHTLKCDMPRIRGIVYFNERRTNAQGVTRDWRLTTSDAATQAWTDLATDEHFGGSRSNISC